MWKTTITSDVDEDCAFHLGVDGSIYVKEGKSIFFFYVCYLTLTFVHFHLCID
jgi:hypothetical protein